MSDQQEWARQELRSRIADSGLSIKKFARLRLLRDEPTIHRWFSQEHPIPGVVCEWLGSEWRLLERSNAEEE